MPGPQPAGARLIMHPATRALLDLYRDPARAAQLSGADWPALFGAMRRGRCMGPLGVRLRQAGVMASLPAPVQGQFETALMTAADRRHLLRWELAELARALAPLGAPVVALKGAAYELQGLPMAQGRTPADVDLLVARDQLVRAETLLKGAGWCAEPMDDYDERYYREWSHEIAPLRHPARRIEVDLHHAVTPSLKGAGVDTERLLAQARACGAFQVLAPADQVIHCALHTFKDSDLGGRLREVMDFDQLVRAFGADDAPAFSARLWARAGELGALRELGLAVRCARRWLGTPVAGSAAATAEGSAALSADVRPVVLADVRPVVPADDGPRTLFDRLLDAAMLPGEYQQPGTAARGARLLMLMRYHLNRMPLSRLLPHLLRKSWQGLRRPPAAPN